MSRQKKSKTSSPLRLGKFQVPNKRPIWMDWKLRELQEIKFAGLKFKAMNDGYTIRTGRNITLGPFGCMGAELGLTRTVEGLSGDSNSCAYQRIYPSGATRDTLIMWAWWLENFYIPRGTVAYLTKNDGDVEAIKRVMVRRGFRTACVTKSKHTGHYPVYLLTHPGDEALLEKKNKKNKKVENVDVLGSADANVSQPGAIGNPVGGYQPDTVVPDAYALGA